MSKQIKVKPVKKIILQCRKCEGSVEFISAELKKMHKTNCPHCGEEPEGNWIFVKVV